MKNPLSYFNRQVLFILAFLPLTLFSQHVNRNDSTWIHYDDVENFDSWGFLISGEIYDVMSKWNPDSLANYEGWAITKIKFIVVHPGPVLKVKIWEGPYATEIYSQDVPSFNVNDWTIVELDSAILIDNTTELYFGYNVDMSQYELGGIVTAIDDGPPVDGYGNLVRWRGEWLSEYNNHNLRALIAETLIADFEADKTTVCDSNAVAFTNLSNYAESYLWNFPGGTPFTSTLENPVITYNTPGTYDVTLTITTGNVSRTEQKQDYITVLEIPGQIDGETLVCDWTEENYAVMDNPGSNYTWEVINGNIISGQGTHQVTVGWQDAGTGYVSVLEETMYDCYGQSGLLEVTIDLCTGMDENLPHERLEIFPNPVNGDELTIRNPDNEAVSIAIYNLNGGLITQQELYSIQTTINIGQLPEGVYILKAIFSDRVETLKIIKG